MHFALHLRGCIRLVYAYCYYNFFLIHGNGFFLSQKLTQCTMEVGWWKFLNYEVICSLSWVACASGAKISENLHSQENILHFWARLAIDTRKMEERSNIIDFMHILRHIRAIYIENMIIKNYHVENSSPRGNWTVVEILLYFFPSFFLLPLLQCVSSSRPCIYPRTRRCFASSYGNLQFSFYYFSLVLNISDYYSYWLWLWSVTSKRDLWICLNHYREILWCERWNQVDSKKNFLA